MEFQILGLKNFVQDDVNHVIAKFVGVKPRPFTNELKNLVRFLKTGRGTKKTHLVNLCFVKFCTVALASVV
jgi:hypothetical protein